MIGGRFLIAKLTKVSSTTPSWDHLLDAFTSLWKPLPRRSLGFKDFGFSGSQKAQYPLI